MYAEHKVILGKYHRLILAPDGYNEAFNGHVDVVFTDTDAGSWHNPVVLSPAKIRFNVSFGNAPMDVSEVEQWAEVINTAVIIAKGWPGPPWLPSNVVEEWRSILIIIGGKQ